MNLRILTYIRKGGDQTFDLFSENRTNAKVNSKPVLLPEYVVYMTFSELIVSFIENRNVL